MLTLADVLRSLELRHWSVPQPEGREVSEAYESGLLTEFSMMRIIAMLLSEARMAIHAAENAR